MLRQYNRLLSHRDKHFPEWLVQFTENEPPLYWKTIYDLLKGVDKTQSIIEIGAGYGDVTTLLYYMGFSNIVCYEMDSTKHSYIEDKIIYLFDCKPNIVEATYPQQLNYTPDILLQVNCVYVDKEKNKSEYLKQIYDYYKANGIPKIYLIEVIDDSYKEYNEIFPYFVRLNEYDIKQLFPKCKISYYKTRIYPFNKTSKTLYCICR
jgi:hypothetical protein